ncbi:MAG TPA: hypothetical protein VHY08_29175 [Bacillota bacterium]|nr:hypothetical protein [Bacillota bacterium]
MLKLILILGILICFFEGLPLYKERKWKELIVFSILIGLSLILSFGKIFGIPTPVEVMQNIMEPIGKTIFKQF